MKIKSILFLVALVAFVGLAAVGQPIAGGVLFSMALISLNLGGQYSLGACYANTLSNLIPDVYAALDVVSRELVGFIPAVTRDSRADRIAVGQTLRSPFTSAASTQPIAVGMAFPTAAYQTIGNKALSITKAKEVPISWQGEEILGLNSGGPGQMNVIQDQFAQAFRALCNEIEADLASTAQLGASRAKAPNDTSLFKTNLADSALVRQILDDNGAPISDRHLVISTTSGAAVRTLTQLTKVNEAGDTTLLRQGTLLDIHGFQLRESAQIVQTVAGTSATAVTDGTNYPIGTTAITLKTAGTGTIVAGDVISFANDTANKYVVDTGCAAVSGGNIILAAPGLRKATGAVERAITITSTFAANAAFNRSAILLATRLPALPQQGDLAIDRTIVTDPRSGVSFEISMYPGKRMITYTVAAVWGTLAVKPEHIALLLG